MTRPALRVAALATRAPLACGTAALLAAACTDPGSSLVRPSDAPNASVVGGARQAMPGGRYLVGVAPGSTLSASTLAAARGRVIDAVPALGIVEVDAANPAALRTAGVRFVEPSFEITLDAQEPAAGPGAFGAADVAAAGTDPSNAPWFANGVQWDMTAMKADGAWAQTSGGAANVCIIDSGIDASHQELVGKVVADTSFNPGVSPAALDSNGHGTHVASTVTGNGIVMSSVAPDAKLMAAKTFAATGGTPVLRVVNAMKWCADRGAHVINASLGGIRFYPPTPVSNEPSYAAYSEAVKYATDRGVVVVLSAGNSNIRLPNGKLVVVPAQSPTAISVGATGPLSKSGVWTIGAGAERGQYTLPRSPIAAEPDWDPFDPEQVWFGPDGKAFYSNYGTAVTVFAPGGVGSTPSGYANRIMTDESGARPQQVAGLHDNVWAACSRLSNYTGFSNVGGQPGAGTSACRSTPTVTTRYARLAGTSMAAPHVAGLAAILYAELGGTVSVANRARVEACIKTTTDDIGPSTTFGGGRVNAVNALACIKRQIPS